MFFSRRGQIDFHRRGRCGCSSSDGRGRRGLRHGRGCGLWRRGCWTRRDRRTRRAAEIRTRWDSARRGEIGACCREIGVDLRAAWRGWQCGRSGRGSGRGSGSFGRRGCGFGWQGRRFRQCRFCGGEVVSSSTRAETDHGHLQVGFGDLRRERAGGAAWLRGGGRAARLHVEGVPAFRAAHLQALRRHAALVDLIRRVARLALDPQHSVRAGYHTGWVRLEKPATVLP